MLGSIPMGKLSDDKPVSPDIKKLIMLADRYASWIPIRQTYKTKWENHGTYTITAGWYTYPSEKCEFASWDDYSQYMKTLKPCSKPPTR
jgi:hypothetical protein